MRHRTTQPDWFGDFDHAWARPLGPLPETVDVDVISASFADIPPDVPPPPVTRHSIGARGEITELAGSGTRLTWSEQGGEAFGWDPVTGVALMLRSEPPNGYDRVSPMRWLVHWSVIATGGVLVHGACVGRSSPNSTRGLLLLGEAGYGKSTTTLACITRGWMTCGDDAVAVVPDDHGWHASPIYAAIKSKLDSSASLPIDLDSEATPATVTWEIAGTKRVHLLTSTPSTVVADRIDLDALVLLSPGSPADAPWVEVTPAFARSRSAPATALSLPFDRVPVLRRMGSLAEEIPSFLLPRRVTVAESVSNLEQILLMSRPRVSVIIPVYRGADFVSAAIESVLNQTMGYFQIVIVDDGSPDDSVAVAEGWRDRVEAAGHDLTVVRHNQNRGIGQARQSGLEAATEALIAFLDQDDVWAPDRTALLVAALRRTGSSVARGRMRFVDATPDTYRNWVRPEWFVGDHVGTVMGAVLADRSVFDGAGWINAAMRSGHEDVDWFLRVRDAGVPVTEVESVVLVRSVHDRNQSRRAAANHADLLTAVRDHVQRLRAGQNGT